MRNLNTLFALLIFASLPLSGQSQWNFNSDSITNILYQYVSDEEPGLAVGIVKNGQIIYEKYLGYANLQHRVKVSDTTRFNIASTAKQFTALFLLQLSMEGKLSLEDDFREYLPALFPEIKEEIKIRHLINHTSGIRDYVYLYEIKNTAWWKQLGKGNKDILALLEKQEDLMFVPGSDFSYSNSNYIIMAAIIEERTGQSFHSYAERFFEEQDMMNTSFLKRYMTVIPNKADPYSDWGSGSWDQFPMVTKNYGDGSLYTTLKDQLKYEVALQNAQKNNNRLLLASQKPIPASDMTSYGFGLDIGERAGRPALYHAGKTGSYNAQVDRLPQENLAIVAMTNNGRVVCQELSEEILNTLLGRIESVEAYDEAYYVDAKSTEQPQITGQYLSEAESLMSITQKEGKWYWQRFDSDPFELLAEGTNSYYFADLPSWKIIFYDEEMVLYEPSGQVNRYKRSKDKPASAADLFGFEGDYYSSELDLNLAFEISAKGQLSMRISSSPDNIYDVKALNRNVLVASGYIIRVERDRFDRPVDVFVTLTDRGRNNRFRKQTQLTFQPQIATEGGSIQVTTIASEDGEATDILLTKNLPNGNEIWSKRLGGNGYDRASSIMEVADGYLIIGSTSSYGRGNYDMYLLKVDPSGEVVWQNTFGELDNEYAYSAEKTETGYLIKGTIQQCSSRDVLNRTCTTSVWYVQTDDRGQELSREVLEQLAVH